MRLIPTYEEFHMGLSEASVDGDSDKEKAKKLETNDEEGPVEDA